MPSQTRNNLSSEKIKIGAEDREVRKRKARPTSSIRLVLGDQPASNGAEAVSLLTS